MGRPGSVAAVLRQVAEGVSVHESEFCRSNAVVVQGRAGMLLVDAGVLDQALPDDDAASDPRLGPSATYGSWLQGVHQRQLEGLARRG